MSSPCYLYTVPSAGSTAPSAAASASSGRISMPTPDVVLDGSGAGTTHLSLPPMAMPSPDGEYATAAYPVEQLSSGDCTRVSSYNPSNMASSTAQSSEPHDDGPVPRAQGDKLSHYRPQHDDSPPGCRCVIF